MGLETGTEIGDLNPLWPLGSDETSFGDDHIRLLKSIMGLDAASLSGNPLAAFAVHPTVPDGATGLQVPNAQDVPGLAGTGPVTIVEDSAGHLVIGDILLQWGSTGSLPSPISITWPIAYEVNPPFAIANSTRTSDGATTNSNVTTTGADFYSFAQAGTAATTGIRWLAIGEAPDALKKPKIVQTAGGTELQEFHDPTGEQSWRIVGTTLEAWGNTITAANTQVITFAKTFLQAPTVTATALSSGARVASSGTPAETGVTLYNWNVANAGAPQAGNIGWHAIGEWDGIS